jgi:acyl carrier protein
VDHDEILEHVKRAIGDLLGIDPEHVVSENDHLQKDLELDVLAVTELVMSLELKFGRSLTDDEAATAETVGDLVRCFGG